MLVVDTGPLVAAADIDDKYHSECLDLLESDPGPLATTAMVIAEAAYLMEREVDAKAELGLYTSIIDGSLRVDALTTADWERVRELVGQYRDLPLGGTDASIVAIAERFGASRIATIDHAHFTVVRPRHVEAFELPVRRR